MKPVHLVLTVVLALFSFSVVAWFGRAKLATSVANSQGKPVSPAKPDTSELPIPATGPYGKAVTQETRFDFGSVEPGDTGSHTFSIKNEGPGPLRVKGGGTSCPQCTVGKVSREDDIPPGETVEVTINWKISQRGGKFRQTADVYTTDPKNPKLVFGIGGTIEPPFSLEPNGSWPLGNLAEGKPTTVNGYLYCKISDKVLIERAECPNPLVSVTWEPADAKLISDNGAKSGLKITISVAPESSIGPFRETVKLHTDIRGGSDAEFDLIGNRPGPIEVKGTGWIPGSNTVSLGEFACTEGKKKTLKMYVRNMEGDLEVQEVQSPGEHPRVTVSPTGQAFGGSRIYDLKIEIPPGPPAMHLGKEPQPVVLKLNHPMVNEFKMHLDYHAK